MLKKKKDLYKYLSKNFKTHPAGSKKSLKEKMHPLNKGYSI